MVKHSFIIRRKILWDSSQWLLPYTDVHLDFLPQRLVPRRCGLQWLCWWSAPPQSPLTRGSVSACRECCEFDSPCACLCLCWILDPEDKDDVDTIMETTFKDHNRICINRVCNMCFFLTSNYLHVLKLGTSPVINVISKFSFRLY